MSFERPALDPIDEGRREWERRWGPPAAAAMATVTSIMRVQQVLLARLNAILKPLGLTFPRYEALMVLHYSHRGALSLGTLGERLQVHRATVTSVVDRLEAQGLVNRIHHQRDRRTILAEITPKAGGWRSGRRGTSTRPPSGSAHWTGITWRS